MSLDFERAARETAGGESLQHLQEAAQEASQLEAKVEQLEADLDMAKKALQRLKYSVIPDLMTTVGFDKFTHEGIEFSLQERVLGSLPADEERRQRAVDWLIAHNASDLLKAEVVAQFGREQHNVAKSLVAQIESQYGIPVNFRESVHSATLQKFVRERLARGEPVDPQVLGIVVEKVARMRHVG